MIQFFVVEEGSRAEEETSRRENKMNECMNQ